MIHDNLTAEQWRILSYLYHPDAEPRTTLAHLMQSQDVARDSILDLVDRRLIHVRVWNEPTTRVGLIKRVHPRRVRTEIARSGYRKVANDPWHLVLHWAAAKGRTWNLRHLMTGLDFPVSFNDMCDLVEHRLIEVTADGTAVDDLHDLRDCPHIGYASTTSQGKTFLAVL